LDVSENKSEIPKKFQNVVLEMEKVSRTNHVRNEGVLHQSQGGKEYPTNNTKKED